MQLFCYYSTQCEFCVYRGEPLLLMNPSTSIHPHRCLFNPTHIYIRYNIYMWWQCHICHTTGIKFLPTPPSPNYMLSNLGCAVRSQYNMVCSSPKWHYLCPLTDGLLKAVHTHTHTHWPVVIPRHHAPQPPAKHPAQVKCQGYLCARGGGGGGGGVNQWDGCLLCLRKKP